MHTEPTTQSNGLDSQRFTWVLAVLLVGILMVGAYFRFIGLNWDSNQHLHPDERFLTMVETSISPVTSLKEYFSTETSSLNPHNRGYGFYVYGTLPLFMVRYIAEWVGKIGYDEVNLVGRVVSGILDLGTVLLVFLIAWRLFKNIRLGLLASAFAAFSVLPIQLSHYFTVDTYTNFFTFCAFLCAVWVMTDLKPLAGAQFEEGKMPDGDAPDGVKPFPWRWIVSNRSGILPCVLFGLSLGLAMASKVSAAPLALLLPGAMLVRYYSLPAADRSQAGRVLIRNLVVAALVSVLVFRIFQPYAFKGPGFFGVFPNEKWVANLRELGLQSAGDVDFPPALQWARRPVTFALQNMVFWGLGIPLGVLAWAGFLWMGWRIFRRGEWKQYVLIWVWTGFYFAWQSINFTRSMRYQLPVYPSLAIIAAWAVFFLWQQRGRQGASFFRRHWRRILAALVGVVVLVGTAAWAYAFTRIYTRPVTRVAASMWIYQNIPGAINLRIESSGGDFNQIVPFRMGVAVTDQRPLVMSFQPRLSGTTTGIDFSHIVTSSLGNQAKTLLVTICADVDGNEPLTSGMISGEFPLGSDPRGNSYQILFPQPLQVNAGRTYYLVVRVLEPDSAVNLAGPIQLHLDGESISFRQPMAEPVDALRQGKNYLVQFSSVQSGQLNEVYIPRIVDWEGRPGEKTLLLTITDPAESDRVLAVGELTSQFGYESDPRGLPYTIHLSQPVAIQAQHTYTLRLEITDGEGVIAIYGSRQAIESSWDDPLPLGMTGYNPFDYYMGVYRSDLNFEMYWDDNEEKLDRFLGILNQADYIFISSNRQWGTTVRVPERYPLTSQYYRSLLGCPEDEDIVWCYSVAKPGMFTGNLGFDLVHVEQSDPNLGSLTFNDQFAEEAFSVYDHPKVLIFKKNDSYTPENAQALLGAVDLTQVVHVTPRKAQTYPGNLMLPADRLATQRSGGTWSDLFNRDDLQNKYPVLAVFLWYIVVALLGWVVYPLVRLAFNHLPDKGYPMVRMAGMLLLAWLVWLAGSFGVAFSRLTITLVALGLLVLNAFLFYLQRKSLLPELRARWRYYLVIEGLALGFFLLFLFIRLGNPDLWHPAKGGEKPMDFSYLNAVIKSTTFPPYDPWFTGGYLNYYYYGFVLVGVLIKWLGIVPSIAYNIFLPTIFSLVALGAFSFGWNVISGIHPAGAHSPPGECKHPRWIELFPLLAGLAAAMGVLVLGNLGTVKMIWVGLTRIGLSGVESPGFFDNTLATLKGFWMFLVGTPMPYGAGEWYWNPSRAIPGEPITEFPFFTFLYADPHAHLFALPITLFALTWGLSIIMGKWRWGDENGRLPGLYFAASILVGSVALGALRPTNTWDMPTFLALAGLAVFYTAFRYSRIPERILPAVPRWVMHVLVAGLATGLLALCTFSFYQPFADWFGQAYTAFDYWKGDHTPLGSYLTHWGLFLFVITSWMVWETREWLANTPVSALNKLRAVRQYIIAILVLTVLLVAGLLVIGVSIAWLVLPMMLWSLLLILRPGQPDVKRAVLFMVGTGLTLTLAVELVALRGDIGRMNTVFKFYLQVWTLFAVSAAAGLMWLFPAVRKEWLSHWRIAWQTAFIILLVGTVLFPIAAGIDKITDRMTRSAPHTLDGMNYMQYSTYSDAGVDMDLSQDYRAIQWMQENVVGSPVIVEANAPEYRWGTRYTIYTGLPGVVGWNWHQRQQRALTPSDWVTTRVEAVGNFYRSTDRQETINFLARYQVEYIIVGQLERAYYSGEGLDRFEAWSGDVWQEVYRDADTVIYQVLP